jgi:hypothetical protein
VVDKLPTQACRDIVVGKPKLVEGAASLERERFQLVELCQCGRGKRPVGYGCLGQPRLERYQ